jgi:hypothetical protein
MGSEPELGQHFSGYPYTCRHVFELDLHQQGEFRPMKDAIPVLGKHDDLAPGLLDEPAPLPLPTHWLPSHLGLLTVQPVGRRSGKH